MSLYKWVIGRIVMTYIWEPDTCVYGWMRSMVNPLSTREALHLPLYETDPGIPLGLVWLQSSAKSLSGVLYCCVN